MRLYVYCDFCLQVRAVNEAGEGEWSESVDVLAGAGAPEAPRAPVCVGSTAHTISLCWQEPCNNGAKISDYRLLWLKPTHQEYSLVRTFTMRLAALGSYLLCSIM